MTQALLDLKAISIMIGVKYSAMRRYQQDATRNRRLAAEFNDPSYIRPGDLPPPDARYRRAPLWKHETIKQWRQSRPGRGAGGGRPRKNRA